MADANSEGGGHQRVFTPLLPGRYLCRIDQVDEGTTRKGDPMWTLRLVVVDGAHRGRWIRDRLVFSPAARERLQRFCGAVGVPVAGADRMKPDAILGKVCEVAIDLDDYTDKQGQPRTGNKVLFEGYYPVEQPAPNAQPAPAQFANDDDDLPF